MRRLSLGLVVAFALTLSRSASAQNQQAITAVKAVAEEWNRAFNAHDAAAATALFDKPIGLFIYGGTAYPLDSIKPFHARIMAQRTNEAWTLDHVDVVLLDDQSAYLTSTYSGHFTTIATGVTWEYKSSAFITALVQKRGSAWKIVAMQNSANGMQLKK